MSRLIAALKLSGCDECANLRPCCSHCALAGLGVPELKQVI